MTPDGPGGSIYAAALFEAVEAEGGVAALETVGAALAAVVGAWEGKRGLRAYFLSSVVSGAEKQAALSRVGAAGLPPLLARFLMLLQRRGRLALLPAIGTAYAERLDARLGRVPVTLTTAAPVEPQALAAWMGSIRAAIGGEPQLRHVVKPEILAGAIIRVGDRVADGSARRRLAELRQKIIERGTHFHALQS